VPIWAKRAFTGAWLRAVWALISPRDVLDELAMGEKLLLLLLPVDPFEPDGM
jgi:hypothetical protein